VTAAIIQKRIVIFASASPKLPNGGGAALTKTLSFLKIFWKKAG